MILHDVNTYPLDKAYPVTIVYCMVRVNISVIPQTMLRNVPFEIHCNGLYILFAAAHPWYCEGNLSFPHRQDMGYMSLVREGTLCMV